MQVYGTTLPNGVAKIRVITLALHNCDAPELWNFNWFMTALRHWFEDHLADWKAWDQIKMVAEYTEEFCNLACCLN